MKIIIRKAADPFIRWFWMLQIYVLRTIPPFLGMISRISMNATRSRRAWLITLFRAALLVPQALFQHLNNVRKKRIVIARMSIGITTHCTLSCDKCIAHIPDMPHKHIPREDLLADMRFLLSCVDFIYDMNLSGGEAFLHPHLDEVIRLLVDSDKVGDVNVTSNGTVMPSEKILSALREGKIAVKISRYKPELQPNVEKLKDLLRAWEIPYIHDVEGFWYDAGDLNHPLTGSAKKRFRVCTHQLCMPYFDGKLHLCAESFYFLHKYPEKCAGDYIDLRTVSAEDFRAQFRALSKRNVISACEYCAGFTYQTPKIPRAEQR